MGHILHEWDLTQKRILLTKVYEAIPKGARSSSMMRLSTTKGARTPSACS